MAAKFTAQVFAVELQEFVFGKFKLNGFCLAGLDEILLDQISDYRQVSDRNGQQEPEHVRHAYNFKQAVCHVGLVERIRTASKTRDIAHNHGAVAVQNFLPSAALGIYKRKLTLFKLVRAVRKETLHVMQFVHQHGIRIEFAVGAGAVKIVSDSGIDTARKIVGKGKFPVHLPDIERARLGLQKPTHQEQKALIYIGLVKVQHAGKIVTRSKGNQADFDGFCVSL